MDEDTSSRRETPTESVRRSLLHARLAVLSCCPLIAIGAWFALGATGPQSANAGTGNQAQTV
jgi:ferric-dicitrate binding protein FerR (iron transport regulator)